MDSLKIEPNIPPNVFPKLTTATVIGISVAITGNILISLSLNIQKLAHKRLDAKELALLSNGHPDSNPRRVDTMYEAEGEEGGDTLDDSDGSSITPRASTSAVDAESQPLILFPRAEVQYGSTAHHSDIRTGRSSISPLSPSRKGAPTTDTLPVMPVEVVSEQTFINGIANGQKGNEAPLEPGNGNRNESEYLKSKLWWTGFLLMNVGEMGNFISYAWAPASVVAPLGTFALVANCFFAPLILKERFRKRDLLGVLIAIIGAVTVVLASSSSSGRLNPDELVKAISTIPFIVYSCVYAVGISVLSVLSEGSVGQQYVLVDVGLCALFGGFTVLSTKAVSTLLTMQWSQVFTKFIMYPVMLVLLLTGIGQIRYLNRALMRFDSKIVIPIQFVLFNLSAIVGSAILYGDFRKATFHQVVTFLYGCGATFLGVFIISWAPESKNDCEDDAENAEEDDSPISHDLHANMQIGSGSLGRRKVATLVLPSGINQRHVLRHKRSSPSVMGISPAQPLLLVHTPPREIPLRDVERAIDRNVVTPDSVGRQRAMSWFGDHSHHRRALVSPQRGGNGRATRDSSVSRVNVSGSRNLD
ncbi:hypothetical protein E1B28_004510 [Marasmius oreades]|uniref:DUF803-domain-containing protein n=1 Tax=Marasmius oreades TaxID=181124 RepID=A0A9P7UYS8_9AGAR|nr:uncharacterized protein E1B28_004510 [Marasmius oreades]KAG7097132.1 hypothetical protein E1B28_004510 [Marasmius oreades]